MSKAYGVAAVFAVETSSGSPQERWKTSVATCFPENEPSRKKSCPKNAFLGLCEEGLVKGIPPGTYSRSRDNKAYALRAVQLLRTGRVYTATDLWRAVMNGSGKAHNGQMDVVLDLWMKGLIN